MPHTAGDSQKIMAGFHRAPTAYDNQPADANIGGLPDDEFEEYVNHTHHMVDALIQDAIIIRSRLDQMSRVVGAKRRQQRQHEASEVASEPEGQSRLALWKNSVRQQPADDRKGDDPVASVDTASSGTSAGSDLDTAASDSAEEQHEEEPEPSAKPKCADEGQDISQVLIDRPDLSEEETTAESVEDREQEEADEEEGWECSSWMDFEEENEAVSPVLAQTQSEQDGDADVGGQHQSRYSYGQPPSSSPPKPPTEPQTAAAGGITLTPDRWPQPGAGGSSRVPRDAVPPQVPKRSPPLGAAAAPWGRRTDLLEKAAEILENGMWQEAGSKGEDTYAVSCHGQQWSCIKYDQQGSVCEQVPLRLCVVGSRQQLRWGQQYCMDLAELTTTGECVWYNVVNGRKQQRSFAWQCQRTGGAVRGAAVGP